MTTVYFADTDVLGIASDALVVALKLAGPPLVVTLIIGLAVSLFQAVFQVQDQTLPMVLKMAGAAMVLVICGPWMMKVMVEFTTHLYTSIPHWAQ